jgi:hypothetical protein
MLLTITGYGIWYVAPICIYFSDISITWSILRQLTLPVKVMTTLQMQNPKKTIGIVCLAVKPSDITEETVLASGGASISEHQYAQ